MHSRSFENVVPCATIPRSFARFPQRLLGSILLYICSATSAPRGRPIKTPHFESYAYDLLDPIALRCLCASILSLPTTASRTDVPPTTLPGETPSSHPSQNPPTLKTLNPASAHPPPPTPTPANHTPRANIFELDNTLLKKQYKEKDERLVNAFENSF